MKKILRQSFLFFSAAVIIYSCRPESFKQVGTPGNAATSLAGTWKLTKVIQTDEDAKNKGFNYGLVNVQTMDLTNVFPYTDFKLTLNMNGNAPTTFTTTPGNSPKLISLTNGNWSFDDPKYPNVLTLTNATDTAKITLGSYPSGASPVLKVTRQKRDASTGKLLISYSYEFTKQ